MVPVPFSLPDVFQYPHRVRDDEIDELGHANNVVYLAWMQAAALAHTAALGWPAERYQQLGIGWVAGPIRSSTCGRPWWATTSSLGPAWRT